MRIAEIGGIFFARFIHHDFSLVFVWSYAAAPHTTLEHNEDRRMKMSNMGQKIGDVCVWCAGAAFAVLAVVTAGVLVWVSVL